MRHVAVLAVLVALLAAPFSTGAAPLDVHDALGPHYDDATSAQHEAELSRRGGGPMNHLRHWNQIAVDASGLDHTPSPDRVFGEQFGPGRSSRAMAIVHIAIFEAVNAIAGGHRSYLGLSRAPANTAMDAAIATAAHDTLVGLFPSQRVSFDALLAHDLDAIPDGRAKANGIELGRRAAAAILTRRDDDGSQHPEPDVGVEFITSNDPGKWRQDPVSGSPSPSAPSGAT